MPSDVIFPLVGERVWGAGHNGIAGSALLPQLGRENYEAPMVDRRPIDPTDQAAARAPI